MHRIAGSTQRGPDPLFDHRVIERTVEHLLDGAICFDSPGKQMGYMFSCRTDHLCPEELPGFGVSVDVEPAYITPCHPRAPLPGEIDGARDKFRLGFGQLCIALPDHRDLRVGKDHADRRAAMARRHEGKARGILPGDPPGIRRFMQQLRIWRCITGKEDGALSDLRRVAIPA